MVDIDIINKNKYSNGEEYSSELLKPWENQMPIMYHIQNEKKKVI